MPDPDLHAELVGHLVDTARSHHAATGGANPDWAEWYAEHLIDNLNETLGTEMTVGSLAEWLEEADRRYNGSDQDVSWPKAYATWLLEEQAGPE